VPPNTPTNTLPANLATDLSLTPTLQSSDFNDPGDTQAASQWQISTVSNSYDSTVFDSVTYAPNLTSVVVPSGLLNYSTTYFWRVRHQDSQLVWSEWSSQTCFTTRPPGSGADFAADATALIAGQSVRFTDTSTGPIVSWTWDFGDGSAPVSWSTRPGEGAVSHTYGVAGSYTVALAVTDSTGASDTETKPAYITVYALPQAGFSASATHVLLGESVAFSSLSTGGVPPLTCAWDFDNDGVVDSANTSPTHSYAVAGAYTVSLKVTDARGNSATETKNGYIVVGDAFTPSPIPLQGGTIMTEDGQIAMTFPARALSADATLTILQMSPAAAPEPPEGYKIGSSAFTLEAVDAYGRAVNSLSRPATVNVKYSEEDMAQAGDAPGRLVLASYDEATGKWTIWSTSVNEADQTLSATTTHFDTWAILVKTGSSGLAPWAKILIAVAAALVVGLVVVWAVAAERMKKPL